MKLIRLIRYSDSKVFWVNADHIKFIVPNKEKSFIHVGDEEIKVYQPADEVVRLINEP